MEEILRNPTTSEEGGVYYYSERGDRLIDLDAFRDRILEVCSFFCFALATMRSTVNMTTFSFPLLMLSDMQTL